MADATAGATTIKHNGSKVKAILAIFIGAVLLIFFFDCILLQVATNKAAFNGTHIASFQADWSLFSELPKALFYGGLGDQQGPSFGAWFIETIYVALGLLYEILADIFHQARGIVGVTLKAGIGIILAFDFVTDIWSGPTFWVSGFFGHLVFTAILVVGVLFCGIAAFKLIEYGLKGLF